MKKETTEQRRLRLQKTSLSRSPETRRENARKMGLMRQQKLREQMEELEALRAQQLRDFPKPLPRPDWNEDAPPRE